jgi:uncharacterized protein DUF5678
MPTEDENDLMTDLMNAVEAEKRLSTVLEQHAGEWVAVKDHEVVADASTLDELLTLVDVEDVDAVFQVAEHATALLLLGRIRTGRSELVRSNRRCRSFFAV